VYVLDFPVLFFYDFYFFCNFLSVNAMLVKALELRSLETEVLIWLSAEQPQVWHQPVPGVFPGDTCQVAPV